MFKPLRGEAFHARTSERAESISARWCKTCWRVVSDEPQYRDCPRMAKVGSDIKEVPGEVAPAMQE